MSETKTEADLTVLELAEWRKKKNALKTIGEFKALGREFRDKFGLTDREAIDYLRGNKP